MTQANIEQNLSSLSAWAWGDSWHVQPLNDWVGILKNFFEKWINHLEYSTDQMSPPLTSKTWHPDTTLLATKDSNNTDSCKTF